MGDKEKDPVELARFTRALEQVAQNRRVALDHVRLARLTGEFLERWRGLEDEGLEEASSFLVAAARLLERKSVEALPDETGEDEADSGEEGTAEELVQRLLEYRRYQEAAALLKSLEEGQQRRYSRLPPEVKAWEDAVEEIEGASLTELVAAFEQLLQAEDEEEPRTIARERVTVKQRMESLLQVLISSGGPVEFESLFAQGQGRREIVVTFLALLELIRLGRIGLAQEGRFGRIQVWSKGEAHLSDKVEG